MIESPFRYETSLTDADYQKIGRILLRCSHIEHIIGNCLKALLRLSDEEAVIVVFPLTADQRLERIKKLAKLADLNADAKAALAALVGTIKYVQITRNDLAHAIIDAAEGQPRFHNRAKSRTVSREDVFAVEELINYVAHAALALRHALGLKDAPEARHALPNMPGIPVFLRR